MRTRKRYRTQFCFIAPGSMLDRYATASHTHLVLPQVSNQQYNEFYIRKRREGDLIILDNGAYEGPIDIDNYCDMIEFYHPHIAVLPDFLLEDGEKTFEAARQFLFERAKHFPQVKWMYIPQSTPGDLQGFNKWMNKFLKLHKNVEWVGIPRALATHIAKGPNARWARVDLVEELTMRGYKTHALGMANGDLEELDALAWEGVCSCDSSCAIWRGSKDILLDNPTHKTRWDLEGVEVDFDFKYTLNPSDQSIRHNINAVLRACGREPFNG